MKLLHYINRRIKILGFKKTIYKILSELWTIFYYKILFHSLSQRGEDILINKFFSAKKNGYYIDIGANDPWVLSNTGFFYKRGWRGITVEPNKALWNILMNERPNDIHVYGLIEKYKGKKKFYIFDPHTLSTSSQSVAMSYIKQGYKLVSSDKVQAYTLADIFSMVPKNKQVDILSIDTEGNELAILKSNDFSMFRPLIICIETLRHDVNNRYEKYNLAIEQYLFSKNYKKIFDTRINSIFIRGK